MLSEMRPSELATWAALYRVDPWGEGRADLRAGIIASAVANYAGKVMAQGHEAKPSDFMPSYDKPPEQNVARDLRNFLMSRPTAKKG